MSDSILFLTGHLAEPSLRRILAELDSEEGRYHVHNIGINVAALMTVAMIGRRLPSVSDVDRIMLPGHCRGDIRELEQRYGIPVERGPTDLKDLPVHLGFKGKAPDLSRYDLNIFAEITDAPRLEVADIVRRAETLCREGANVIDLGCLPETPFPHLEESVQALQQAGFKVSVDSLNSDDLLRGGRAGADYLLSLTENTLWIADEVPSTPILIPAEAGDLDSLSRAIKGMEQRGRHHVADAILDPIHFGFTEAICRYRDLRQRHPETDIMFGAGNVTELTEADTVGISTLLMGICSELRITYMLTTQVSEHARTVVRETDRARRVMYASRENQDLPKGYGGDLLALHERKPYPDTLDEIRELAGRVRDPNFRIHVTEEGLHIYNRDGLHSHHDPFELFPHLGVEEDGGHAFYLGVELARAQIALQLGKRYVQDEELRWGALVDPPPEDKLVHRNPGPTMKARRKRSSSKEKAADD
ncbi:DUF6513 domain-containing protein [Methylonatrum kenyense]|uniref:DUF6513 domain-containing protein n=1 Tax=Methylonatrum kenyense TaxID=455253 RepID=UPI0020C012F5|nr:DUF6513 domain-containing protein [Methylonatrum kenyense]